MSEDGKKRLKELAKHARDKVEAARAPLLLEQRGQELLEDLAKELGGPEGMPGLKLLRDSPKRLRVQRAQREAELTLEWEREIGALAFTCERRGEPKTFVRYVWDEAENKWRKLDGGGEIYDDVTSALVAYLYPEMQPR